MIIQEYIISKFQQFGIKFSDADLADVDIGVDITEEFSEANRADVFKALAMYVIPQFLLRAKAISENGFSISWDNDALKDYYSWICKTFGIEDNINELSSITDQTDAW